jgi:hypothetical protein
VGWTESAVSGAALLAISVLWELLLSLVAAFLLDFFLGRGDGSTSSILSALIFCFDCCFFPEFATTVLLLEESSSSSTGAGVLALCCFRDVALVLTGLGGGDGDELDELSVSDDSSLEPKSSASSSLVVLREADFDTGVVLVVVESSLELVINRFHSILTQFSA